MRRPWLLACFDRGADALIGCAPASWAADSVELRCACRDVCEHAWRRTGWRGLLSEGTRELLDLARAVVAARLGRTARITPAGPPPTHRKGHAMFARLVHDVRLALRTLAATRLTTAIALVTLALGIGITAAAFSVLDSVVLRTMPFPHADRLVEIWNRNEKQQFNYPRFSRNLLLEWRKQTDLFDAIEGYEAESVIWKGEAGAEMIAAAYVTPGLLPMLGVAPKDGRMFVPGDGRQGSEHLVVISERFWRERLGSTPTAVGGTVTLNGTPHTVVGIMPASFHFPYEGQQMWLPIDVDQPPADKLKGRIFLVAFARMRPELTKTQIADQVATRGTALVAAVGGRAGVSAAIHDKSANVDRTTSQSLYVLAGAVGFLLLIVCANIANLSLSRMLTRARDFAVRGALGASRGDLVREALVEHAVLGLAGAALGLLVAQLTLDIAVANLPQFIVFSSLNEIDLDGRALLFTGAVGLITALLFGVPPALIASRPAIVDVLRRDSRASAGSAGSRRLRSALVMAEVTVALVLLVGAALMARSFLKLQGVDRGFDTSSLVAVRVGLPAVGYLDPRDRDRFTEEMLEAVRRLPGVRAVTAGSVPPDSSIVSFGSIEIAGRQAQSEKEVIVPVHETWPNYFQAVGIPLKEGRGFTELEPATSVIVSESFARAYWPEQSAVGGQFRFTGAKEWRTIVGVAGEVRQMDLDDRHGAFEWYTPLRTPAGAPPPATTSTEAIVAYRTFVISADDPAAIVGRARQVVHTLDANVVIWKVDQVDHLFAEAVERPRVVLVMMAVLAGLGLVLAGAGIYGVLSYLVAQRRREIGIRLALGARPAAIGRNVLRSALGLTAVGLAAGLALSLALTRMLQSLLYQVEPTDPLSMVAVTVVLLGIAAVAAWRPARHAMRVDPLALLREQ